MKINNYTQSSSNKVGISTRAIFCNYKKLRLKLKDKNFCKSNLVSIGFVGDQDAYGHSLEISTKPLAPYPDFHITFENYLKDDLKNISKFTKNLNITVIQSLDNYNFLKAKNCTFNLTCIEDLIKLGEISKEAKNKISYEVTIGILNEFGIKEQELGDLFEISKKYKNLKLEGIRINAIECKVEKRTDLISKTNQLIRNISGLKGNIKWIHVVSKSLFKELCDLDFNLKLTLINEFFGLNSENNFINFERVLTFKSYLIEPKIVPAKYPIGYDRTYITPKATPIGVIPLGYGDGITRSLSNKGAVIIKGKICKIIGRVSMNQFVIDLSPISNNSIDNNMQNFEDYIQEGELVTVVGRDSNSEITVAEIASWSGIDPLDFTSNIPPNIERFDNDY